MARFYFLLVSWSFIALLPLTMAGSSLSASVNADFVTNAATATCVESSGGGPGTAVAPLTGCLQTFGQSMFQSQGSASAAYGTLRVLGSVSYTDLSLPSGDSQFQWLLKAEADIQDTLTVSQGSFLDVTIDFSGSESHAGAFFFIDGASVPYNFPGPNAFRLPFKAGVPFAFDEDLRVDLEGILMLGQPQGQSFSQFVDLSHTVQIVSTEVVDSEGNPIPGATITSESGFDYANPLGTSAAPEPASFGFLLAGMAVICGRSYCKRRRNRPDFPRNTAILE